MSWMWLIWQGNLDGHVTDDPNKHGNDDGFR